MALILNNDFRFLNYPQEAWSVHGAEIGVRRDMLNNEGVVI